MPPGSPPLPPAPPIVPASRPRRSFLLTTATTALAGLLGCGGEPVPQPRPPTAEVAVAVAAPEASNEEDNPPPGPSEWKVGVYLDLPKGELSFGRETREGIQLAIDDVNAKGGPKGIPLRAIYADDSGDPRKAAKRVLRFIEHDDVVALLGSTTSSRSLVGGTIANRKGIPMISPSSTLPSVTKIGPFVFRSCFADDAQGRAAARFVVNTLGKKKLAILYGNGSEYSTILADELRNEAAKLGATVVIDKLFMMGEMQFSTYLTSIKAAKPDIVFAPVHHDQIGPIVRQAKALGMAASMFLGGDAWDALSPDDRVELEGAYFMNHYASDDPSPRVQDFAKRFKARFGHDAGAAGATGYESAALLADAIGRATDFTPESIREAIAQTKDFAGLTGATTIDVERNGQKPVIMLQIKSGEYRFHSTVKL